MIRAMRNGSTNQSGKILATSEEFVPTAFHLPSELSASALPDLESVSWQVAMKRAIRSGSELRKAVGYCAGDIAPVTACGLDARSNIRRAERGITST